MSVCQGVIITKYHHLSHSDQAVQKYMLQLIVSEWYNTLQNYLKILLRTLCDINRYLKCVKVEHSTAKINIDIFVYKHQPLYIGL